MAKVIDMQFMRYINLFEKFSGVSTSDCFVYNGTLFFGVPKSKLFKAMGPKGKNLKKLSEVLRRRVRIIEIPSNDSGIKSFIINLIAPIEVNNVEVTDGEVTIYAAMQSRAMLIGRGRAREKELLEILNKTFGIRGIKICQ